MAHCDLCGSLILIDRLEAVEETIETAYGPASIERRCRDRAACARIVSADTAETIWGGAR